MLFSSNRDLLNLDEDDVNNDNEGNNSDVLANH